MRLKSLIFLTSLFFLSLSCDENSVTDPDNDNNENPTFSYDHTNAPGASATDFLKDDDFEKLVIEVDYMEGYKPTEEALNNLQLFFEDRLNKKSITILTPTSITAVGQSFYSDSDVRDLEESNRSEFSEENTLAAYIIILDGAYEQNNVLGIAFYNTSTALFGESIENASSGVGSNPQRVIEATVLQHEFGHLFGLVNNGVEMQQDHQDDQNDHHCTNNNCLMYYSVRTTDFFSVLLGGNIPELDSNCRADLQAAGGK